MPILKTSSKISINYKINFVDIFLFINNKWWQKILQLLLITLLLTTGYYLRKFLDSKPNISFINDFLINLGIYSVIYLFFFIYALS